MKLTTDRHKASRGLFATAELLVFPLQQLIGKERVRISHQVSSLFTL